MARGTDRQTDHRFAECLVSYGRGPSIYSPWSPCSQQVCCWTSLQSAQNLRGPHVARQQQLPIDLLPAPDLSSKPAGRRRCCRPTGQTDGRTNTRPSYDACRMISGLRTARSTAGVDRISAVSIKHRGSFRYRLYERH